METNRRSYPWVSAVVLVSCCVMQAGLAAAQVAETPTGGALDPRARYGQRNFGVSANIGSYTGAAVGLRAGLLRIGVEGSFGVNPILIFYTDPSDGAQLKAFASSQVNASIYAVFAQLKRVGIGMVAGYKYNSVLGHGGGAGAYASFDLTRVLALQGMLGLAVFPQGEDNVVKRLPDPCDGLSSRSVICSGRYSFGITPAVQFGFTVGLVFFPG